MISKAEISKLWKLCKVGYGVPWEPEVVGEFRPGTVPQLFTGTILTAEGKFPSNGPDSCRDNFFNSILACEARNWLPKLLTEIERLQANLDVANREMVKRRHKRKRC